MRRAVGLTSLVPRRMLPHRGAVRLLNTVDKRQMKAEEENYTDAGSSVIKLSNDIAVKITKLRKNTEGGADLADMPNLRDVMTDDDFESFGGAHLIHLVPSMSLKDGLEALNEENLGRAYAENLGFSSRQSFCFLTEEATPMEAKEEKIHWLTGEDGKIMKVIGIVTERDFLRNPDKIDTGESMESIMTPVRRMSFSPASESIWTALKTMTLGRFRHLPVCDEKTMEVLGCVNLQQLMCRLQKMSALVDLMDQMEQQAGKVDKRQGKGLRHQGEVV